MRRMFLHTLAIVGIGSFFIHHNAWAETSLIVINEIGAYESSGLEWIEIYNGGNDAINLAGWSFWENDTDHGLALVQGVSTMLASGAFVVIAQDADQFFAAYPFVSSTIFDSAWGSLKESGELIGLKNAEGTIVESFTYIAAPDRSLERIDASLSDYSEANWEEHSLGNSVGEVNDWTTNMKAQEHEKSEAGNEGVKDDGGSKIEEAESEEEDGASETSETGDTEFHEYTSIIISEFLADPLDGNEWIELYNLAATSTDLNGWIMTDAAGVIVSPSSTIVGYGFLAMELPSSKLNNGGDTLSLLAPNGTVVDTISYGDGNGVLPSPKKGNTLARGVDLIWKESETPTKGVFNMITSPALSSPQSETVTNTSANSATKKESSASPSLPKQSASGSSLLSYPKGTLLINEIVSDPADDEEEFIELYNPTENMIPLAGWIVEDGSEKETAVEGVIGSKQFFVVKKPNGNLNNSGDIVFLRDPAGNIIDQVTYGVWDDGNTGDNASAAKDPFSLSRIGEGTDTGDDGSDFALTMTVTKEKKNVFAQKNSPDASTVIISEVYPNPVGSDTLDEFIEFQNIGNTTIDLSGWEIGDTQKRRYTITQGLVVPGAYAVFKRSQTNIALNNTGTETVFLWDLYGNERDALSYEGKVSEGVSYIKEKGKKVKTTTQPTPGLANVLQKENNPPIIVIDTKTAAAVSEPVLVDASDTADPDGDAIRFSWQVNGASVVGSDVMEYRFAAPGLYTISLSVYDGQGATSTEEIRMNVGESADGIDSESFVGGFYPDELQFIQFSELFPNPEGRDDNEFIELYNPLDIPLPLGGLFLDDDPDGSRPYVIPDTTVIDPKTFLVFEREETGIALNNTKDAARLLYPDKSLVTAILYDVALEGASYIMNDIGAWMWTSQPTPGEANVIAAIEEIQSVKKTKQKNGAIAVSTTLQKLGDEDIGDMILVDGTVTVLPNTFGSQYFYITDTHAGVQVYLSEKNFPKLAIGDRVAITGVLGEFQGALRIKVKKKEDITVTGHVDLPAPPLVSIVEISSRDAGRLIAIEGEVTERKTAYLYLDDGNGEIKISVKKNTGIDVKSFQIGQTLAIVGILTESNREFRLLPRSREDVRLVAITSTPSVIEEIPLDYALSTSSYRTHLATAAGGLASLALGFFAKARSAAIAQFLRRVVSITVAIVRRMRG